MNMVAYIVRGVNKIRQYPYVHIARPSRQCLMRPTSVIFIDKSRSNKEYFFILGVLALTQKPIDSAVIASQSLKIGFVSIRVSFSISYNKKKPRSHRVSSIKINRIMITIMYRTIMIEETKALNRLG